MSSSDAGSDDDIRRPRGRAARRMMKDLQDGSSPQLAHRSISPKSQDDVDLYHTTPQKNSPIKYTFDFSRDATATPASERPQTSLFVSPTRTDANDSDDELPTVQFTSKQRFAELVAQKRAEREAREAAAEQERLQNHSDSADVSSDLPEASGGLSGDEAGPDPEVERIMSDATKPTRKASKKALLSMERETQRLARQQALAHQMKVKKKFTTSDLLARFNYHQPGQPVDEPVDIAHDASSSVPNSDGSEPQSARKARGTPPSSPPTPLDRQKALVDKGALSKLVPVREDSITSLMTEVGDGAAATDDVNTFQPIPLASSPSQKQGLKPFRLARLNDKTSREALTFSSDDDDDLDIIHEEPSRFKVFDKVKKAPSRQHADSAAIHILKHLSHIGTDPVQNSRRKKGAARPSVNPTVLETQLRLRARDQARAQQLERIAELKAKGIDVLSAEDREKEAEEFENLLEKARQDAVKLRQMEKAASKKEREENGMVASDDESEDEDYEEGMSDVDSEGQDAENEEGNELVEDAAEESEDEEEEDEEEDDEEESGEDAVEEAVIEEQDQGIPTQIQPHLEAQDPASQLQTPRVPRKSRKSRVILDDDEESGDVGVDKPKEPSQPAADADDDDPFAAFGFGQANALMSPTQAFHATMQTPTQATEEDSFEVFRRFAPPSMSSIPPVHLGLDSMLSEDSQGTIVPGSQVAAAPQINLDWETQLPETPVPNLKRGASAMSLGTPGWEPTQDDGLPSMWPSRRLVREETQESVVVENETQETVRIRISESPAPSMIAAAGKRTRLVRGQRPILDSSDDEADANEALAQKPASDAFGEMARRRREALTAAERAEAERQARNMMDEQAEESEDEYAGLGGDDFVAPETEQDRDIIDSSHIEVDEHALAAHYAERQRIEDEANATKLYRDLTTGALRRRNANMFDLDEDEDDVAIRRRQAQQREEARRRRLLLQDDKIAGLAEGKNSKGKDAFLKAIADDDDEAADDDMLDASDAEAASEEPSQAEAIQAGTDAEPSGVLKEITGNKRRREEAADERLPAHKRRTIESSAFRRPTSLLEVKQSLSFLLEDPNTVLVASTLAQEEVADQENVDDLLEVSHAGGSENSDDDDDEVAAELARQNDGGYAPDRALMPPPRLPASQRRTSSSVVVDRLSLKRSASNSETSSGPSAWGVSGASGPGVPSLLRRATTNTAAFMNANERGVSTSNGSLSRENSGGSGGVKMGGTKRSSLAYQARAEERRAIVEASALKRAENTKRIAQLRRTASAGVGKGLVGRFE